MRKKQISVTGIWIFQIYPPHKCALSSFPSLSFTATLIGWYFYKSRSGGHLGKTAQNSGHETDPGQVQRMSVIYYQPIAPHQWITRSKVLLYLKKKEKRKKYYISGGKSSQLGYQCSLTGIKLNSSKKDTVRGTFVIFASLMYFDFLAWVYF